MDTLPASCGALAPFRLCSRSQTQSSPWDPTSNAGASAPSPHLPQRVSRQASRAGECWWALILCVETCLLCLPHSCFCTLLHCSEASPLCHPHICPQRGFLVCGNLSSFMAPSHWCRFRPCSFVSVFFFFLLPYAGTSGVFAFWEV